MVSVILAFFGALAYARYDWKGRPLFQQFLLPFEIASFLLLAAMVGAVLITKRRLT